MPNGLLDCDDCGFDFRTVGVPSEESPSEESLLGIVRAAVRQDELEARKRARD